MKYWAYLPKINNKIITIFREDDTSALAGFHAGPLSWSNWNLEMEGRGRKTGEPGGPTTNSTHTWHWPGIEPEWAALVGGERSHHCVIAALQNKYKEGAERIIIHVRAHFPRGPISIAIHTTEGM